VSRVVERLNEISDELGRLKALKTSLESPN
jgi:hypothetical protein